MQAPCSATDAARCKWQVDRRTDGQTTHTMWQCDNVTFVQFVPNCSQINFTFRICFVSIFRRAMEIKFVCPVDQLVNFVLVARSSFVFASTSVAAVHFGGATVAHSLHSSPWLIATNLKAQIEIKIQIQMACASEFHFTLL